MSGSFTLFCWIQGDEHDQAFPLDVLGTQKVWDLKEEIKEKKKDHDIFQYVDARSMNIWKVSISN